MFKWKYEFSLLWCIQCFQSPMETFRKPLTSLDIVRYLEKILSNVQRLFLCLWCPLVFILEPLLFLGTPYHSKNKFHASFNIQLPNALVIPPCHSLHFPIISHHSPHHLDIFPPLTKLNWNSPKPKHPISIQFFTNDA